MCVDMISTTVQGLIATITNNVTTSRPLRRLGFQYQKLHEGGKGEFA